MLRLVKAFWDLAVWRMSPAQLPASMLLLGIIAAILVVLELLDSLLPSPAGDHLFIRIALSVGLPIAWTWVVLVVARHRQRFLQTASALLGIAALSEAFFYPLGWLMHALGQDDPLSDSIKFLLLVGVVWYLLACANVWRAALDSRLSVGIVMSLAYFLGSVLLEYRLLPDT
jgi:hypothetical protein